MTVSIDGTYDRYQNLYYSDSEIIDVIIWVDRDSHECVNILSTFGLVPGVSVGFLQSYLEDFLNAHTHTLEGGSKDE